MRRLRLFGRRDTDSAAQVARFNALAYSGVWVEYQGRHVKVASRATADAGGVALVDLGRPFGEVPLDDLRILDEEPAITVQEAAEFEERARLSFIDPNNFDIDEPEHLSRDSGLIWERTTGRRFRAERPDHRALMDRLVAIWNQKRPVATRRLDVIQAATDQLPEELVAVAGDVLDWYGLAASQQAAVILKLGADWADNRRGERIYDKR